MRFIKKVMERGTITLPSDLREALGVHEGDIVEFEVVGIVKKQDGSPVEASSLGVSRPTAKPRHGSESPDADASAT